MRHSRRPCRLFLAAWRTCGGDGSLIPAASRAAHRAFGNPSWAKLISSSSSFSAPGAESSSGGGVDALEAEETSEAPPTSSPVTASVPSSDADPDATTAERKQLRVYARRPTNRVLGVKGEEQGEEAAERRRSAGDACDAGDDDVLINPNDILGILVFSTVRLVAWSRARGRPPTVNIALHTSDAAVMAALHARDDVLGGETQGACSRRRLKTTCRSLQGKIYCKARTNE